MSILKIAARIVLGLAMIAAGTAHLTVQRKEFRAQVPRWLPQDSGFQDFVVLSSGVVEIALGLATVLWVQRKRQVGITLAVFYVLVFPGNISQYTNHVNGFGLDTDQKRFARLFFQPVLVLWAPWASGALESSAIKRNRIG